MANFNISDLTVATTTSDADTEEILQGGVNKQITNLLRKRYTLINVFQWVGNVAIGSTGLSALTGATGSGASGAILKGNVFYNTVAATALLSPDGLTLVPAGCFIVALQDSPTLVTHFAFITTMI